MQSTNLDTLRQSWQNIKIEVEQLKMQNRQLTERIVNNQVKSVRDMVVKKYRFLCILGLVYTPIMTIICLKSLQMGVIPTILFSLYFPLSVIINGSVLLKAKNISPATMTMRQMLVSFTDLRIHRSRCRILGYACCAPMLAGLLYYMYTVEPVMSYAGVLGGFIGMCIGIYQDLKISRQIREMRRQLAEELSDEDEESTLPGD